MFYYPHTLCLTRKQQNGAKAKASFSQGFRRELNSPVFKRHCSRLVESAASAVRKMVPSRTDDRGFPPIALRQGFSYQDKTILCCSSSHIYKQFSTCFRRRSINLAHSIYPPTARRQKISVFSSEHPAVVCVKRCRLRRRCCLLLVEFILYRASLCLVVGQLLRQLKNVRFDSCAPNLMLVAQLTAAFRPASLRIFLRIFWFQFWLTSR